MKNIVLFRENIRTKIVTRFPNLGEWVYLSAFALYLLAMALKGTMLVNFLITERGIFYLSAVPALFVMGKILFLDDYDWKELVIYLLLETLLFAVGTNANEYMIFYLLFFIVGAKGINVDRILQVYLIVNLSVIALAFIFSSSGFVKNVTVTRTDSPAVRFALGAVYPTDLASRVFFMMIAYAALKRFSFSLAEYCSYVALTALTYIVTDTRIDLMLMVLLLLCIALYRPIEKLLNHLSAWMLTAISTFYVFLIIIMGYLYSPHIGILEKINHFLSGRLFYERLAFTNYNVTPFGQFIYQNGFGGGFKVVDYFYIDASYVRTLMMHGVLVFMLMLILFYLLFARFKTEKLNYWIICLALVLLTSGIDQHLWDISYNFIFLALMAILVPIKTKKAK
ncbi:hypothetical protein [Ligilactobacillus apodemi]|uniref:hypothetical protein n=1 Tax=Ligilactobacillus apodemi TaxID=307126 RepID=UPI00214B80B0|nr:hypothetical protein [Ligilactobacillus apodemi]MCR1901941.1 hypothetical protein [Ligilactobacillus apodemi]